MRRCARRSGFRGPAAPAAPTAPAAPAAPTAPTAAASTPSATRALRSTSQAGSKSQAEAKRLSEKRRLWRLSPRAQEEGQGEPPPPPTPATPTSSASTLDLGEQRELWEMFQKRQKLTSEGAAKLLLDTFEYQGLVKHTGGCHCFGIAPHCLDEGTVQSMVTEEFNGSDWEKAMKEHKTIKNMSKE
ncbi:hypothetical protein P7K49_011473 [Saguinus oedipus]|uniref:Uncharacterized protein n=1 Tax=Saguinus oedipus TaxID=9490 RepID=A0ABQ9VU96_SAGOE|nr:hypothetical protein P7K49_011473 [Saguinus oedipus]